MPSTDSKLDYLWSRVRIDKFFSRSPVVLRLLPHGAQQEAAELQARDPAPAEPPDRHDISLRGGAACTGTRLPPQG